MNIDQKTIRNKKFYRDKSSLALSLSPNSGFALDLGLRKVLLNHFGWQVSAKFFQEAVNVGNVKEFATEVVDDHPDYTDNSAFTFAGGFMGAFGFNYNLTMGDVILVPQVNVAFAKINVADDPWFGKDRFDTTTKEQVESTLAKGFTYFFSGSLTAYFDKESGDDWFLKMEFGQFGEFYMPLFISIGGGIQFSL